MTTPRDTSSGGTGRETPGGTPAPRPDAEQSEQRPTEQRPTEQRPTEQRPTEQRPTEQRPTEQRPTEQGPGTLPRAVPPGSSDPRATTPPAHRPGRVAETRPASAERPTTTVLPSGARPERQAPPRPAAPAARPAAPAGARPPAPRTRRARLSLRRIDPWSVFVFSLVATVFLGVSLVVAVAVLYAVLGSLGVTGSLNELLAEVTGGNASTDPVFTAGRIIGGAALLAAVNVVLLTLLATLGALLYNLCSSFTGGLELTFGERD